MKIWYSNKSNVLLRCDLNTMWSLKMLWNINNHIMSIFWRHNFNVRNNVLPYYYELIKTRISTHYLHCAVCFSAHFSKYSTSDTIMCHRIWVIKTGIPYFSNSSTHVWNNNHSKESKMKTFSHRLCKPQNQIFLQMNKTGRLVTATFEPHSQHIWMALASVSIPWTIFDGIEIIYDEIERIIKATFT